MKALKIIFCLLVSFLLLPSGVIQGSEDTKPINLTPEYLLLLSEEPKLPAPTNLTATPLSSRTILLTWQDNSDGEDGFLVEIEVNGSFFPNYEVDADRNSVVLGPLLGKNFSPATTYRFRIKAFKGTAYINATQESGYSNIATVTTLAAPPAPPNAPANLTATAMSTSKISLAWTDTSNNEDYFRIERSADCSSYKAVGWVVTGSTSFTDENLEADSKYCYRVRAENQVGNSGWSNVVNVSTPPPKTVPMAPSNLTASLCDRVSCIQLAWKDNSSTEDAFYLERSAGGNQAWEVIQQFAKNTTGGYDGQLIAFTPYYYRVRAKNSFGYSDYSNEFMINSATKGTTAPLPPQEPPTAVALSSNSIRVTWTDSSTNEDSFKIGRSFTPDRTTFQVVGTVGAGVTTFDDGGLTPQTTYYYMIYACNIAGCRENGLTGSATTLPVNTETAPPAPASLTITPVQKSSTALHLEWQDNSSNESGFKVYRSNDANQANSQLVATVNANIRAFDNTGLQPCSTYHYWVYAYNSMGNSSGFAAGSSTTAPAAPTGLIASTGTAIHFIFLDWNATACAAKYHVYRINSWDIGPILADPQNQNIINPQADDPNVTPLPTFYRVSAENAAGHEGSMSCTTSAQAAHGGATGPNDTCLAAVGCAASPAPQLLAASRGNSANTVIVSWNAVQVYWNVDGYSTASWAPGYRLFFDNGDGAGFRAVPNGNNGYILANENSSNPLTFTHNNLPSNYTFHYALQTVYDCGATFPDTCTFSDWASTYGTTASDPVANVLGAPTVTASEYYLDVIMVGWSFAPGADSYKLYRATSSAGTYTNQSIK